MESIFAEPTSKALAWDRIESLLKAVGCEVVEGNGSRVRFVYGARVSLFHRPHPHKEAKAYQVEQARVFLTQIGVTP